MEKMQFELMAKVKDHLSGFSGVVSARAQYFNSSNIYLVTAPTTEAGKTVEAWVDEGRLVLVE